MAKKVVRRPVLTFWEKLYIPQVLTGLKITSIHFFRNLFLHIAHRFGMFRSRRAGVTIQYPEELRPLFSRYRSRHRLTLREDDTPSVRGMYALRNGLPGQVHHHRARRTPRPPRREISRSL